jgi:hypothetical protein
MSFYLFCAAFASSIVSFTYRVPTPQVDRLEDVADIEIPRDGADLAQQALEEED